jgi:hypothetical protein
LICESCCRKYNTVHELEEFKLKDPKTNEKISVFECPICSWIMPDYSFDGDIYDNENKS